jgi:Calcineurin-like phosphoesterase
MDAVADQMTAELHTRDLAQRPAFFFHLGDVIYHFGELQYYFDQLYVPWRHYRAPILAIAGNHDGMVVPGSNRATLDGFLTNFCAEAFGPPLPAMGGMKSKSNIQDRVAYRSPLVIRKGSSGGFCVA